MIDILKIGSLLFILLFSSGCQYLNRVSYTTNSVPLKRITEAYYDINKDSILEIVSIKEFDKWGKVVRKSWGNALRSELYYDKKDSLVREIIFDKNDLVYAMEFYKYKYDDIGRLKAKFTRTFDFVNQKERKDIKYYRKLLKTKIYSDGFYNQLAFMVYNEFGILSEIVEGQIVGFDYDDENQLSDQYQEEVDSFDYSMYRRIETFDRKWLRYKKKGVEHFAPMDPFQSWYYRPLDKSGSSFELIKTSERKIFDNFGRLSVILYGSQIAYIYKYEDGKTYHKCMLPTCHYDWALAIYEEDQLLEQVVSRKDILFRTYFFYNNNEQLTHTGSYLRSHDLKGEKSQKFILLSSLRYNEQGHIKEKLEYKKRDGKAYAYFYEYYK